MNNRIIVIGGGASGMMAAGTAAECGKNVMLIEQNKVLGKKLLITGKGRCNITNACDEVEDLLCNVVTNKRFLYSAFYTFDNHSTIDFLKITELKQRWKEVRASFPFRTKVRTLRRL